MKIDILTLFPEMFEKTLGESILKRAQKKGLVKISVHNLRDWAQDKHKTVDDKPYGGGPGMIIKVDIVDRALAALKSKKSKVILMDARGETFSHTKAVQLSKEKHLIILSGHYEDFDARVKEHMIDEAISIGNFVLTGGEIPAMAVVDATVRLIPGVIEEESLKEESHSKKDYLEYPQYTRPEEYKGWMVPKVLLSGNHKDIEKWKINKTKGSN